MFQGSAAVSEEAATQQYWEASYLDVDRFVSYAYQLEAILNLAPRTLLEVGIGPGIISGFLRNAGLEVTTCDLARSLNPDCLGDIRALPFKEDQFDVAVAFEVLEHLPFSELERAAAELHRVSRRHVVISLPYSCASFHAAFRINAWRLARTVSFADRKSVV